MPVKDLELKQICGACGVNLKIILPKLTWGLPLTQHPDMVDVHCVCGHYSTLVPFSDLNSEHLEFFTKLRDKIAER